MTTLMPEASPGRIMGFLEILEDYKGKADLARVAADFDLGLDELLPSVQAAELLGFVRVGDGDVEFTEMGRKILRASPRQRKAIFRDQALKTEIFKTVVAKLKQAGGHLTKDELAEVIGFKLWTNQPEAGVRTIIGWGRHGQILTFDAATREIRLL